MFDQVLDDTGWQSFYGAVAQVSGGLVGLVFVGLTFHPRLLHENRNGDLHRLAVQTFQDFVQVLVISLVMLVPDMSVGSVAVAMLLFSSFALYRVAGRLRTSLRADAGSRGAVRLRFGLSVLGQSILIGASVLLMIGSGYARPSLMLVYAAVMILLISGSRSAWLLVAHELE